MMAITRGNPNRERLEETARRLGPLLEEIVFLGGAIVDLLITDRAAFRPRPTDDVDVVVACTTRVEYDAMRTRLQQIGFHPDTRAGAPVCRTRTADGYVLDVMPLDERILGFSNRWYALVLDHAQAIPLADDLTIRIATPCAFLLTKWEAFRERGAADPLGSHDLEDLIMLVAGRRELVNELHDIPREAREFLKESIESSMSCEWFMDAIEGATPDSRLIPELVNDVRQRFEAIRDALEFQ